MLHRLKEKWELYVVIAAMVGVGYLGREYVYNIEQSNAIMYKKATRHSDLRDSLWRIEWRGTENIEEGRFQASEQHRIRTEMALEALRRENDRYHYGIKRDLQEVARTQATAITRDSIRRASHVNLIERSGL